MSLPSPSGGGFSLPAIPMPRMALPALSNQAFDGGAGPAPSPMAGMMFGVFGEQINLLRDIKDILADIFGLLKSLPALPSAMPVLPSPVPADPEGKRRSLPSLNVGRMFAQAKGIGQGMAGAGAEMVVSMIGQLTGKLAVLTGGVAAAAGAVAGMTSAALSAGRSLANFSPNMAAAFAKFDISNMMRGQRMGEALAPEFSSLTEHFSRFMTMMEPIAEFVLKGLSRFLTNFLRGMEVIVVAVGKGFGHTLLALNQLLGWIRQNSDNIDKMGNELINIGNKLVDADKERIDPMLNRYLRSLANGDLRRRDRRPL